MEPHSKDTSVARYAKANQHISKIKNKPILVDSVIDEIIAKLDFNQTGCYHLRTLALAGAYESGQVKAIFRIFETRTLWIPENSVEFLFSTVRMKPTMVSALILALKRSSDLFNLKGVASQITDERLYVLESYLRLNRSEQTASDETPKVKSESVLRSAPAPKTPEPNQHREKTEKPIKGLSERDSGRKPTIEPTQERQIPEPTLEELLAAAEKAKALFALGKKQGSKPNVEISQEISNLVDSVLGARSSGPVNSADKDTSSSQKDFCEGITGLPGSIVFTNQGILGRSPESTTVESDPNTFEERVVSGSQPSENPSLVSERTLDLSDEKGISQKVSGMETPYPELHNQSASIRLSSVSQSEKHIIRTPGYPENDRNESAIGNSQESRSEFDISQTLTREPDGITNTPLHVPATEDIPRFWPRVPPDRKDSLMVLVDSTLNLHVAKDSLRTVGSIETDNNQSESLLTTFVRHKSSGSLEGVPSNRRYTVDISNKPKRLFCCAIRTRKARKPHLRFIASFCGRAKKPPDIIINGLRLVSLMQTMFNYKNLKFLFSIG